MLKQISLTGLALALMIMMTGCGGGPDTPSSLSVTSSSPITLSWNAVSGSTSYKVYRGAASGALSSKTLLAADISGTTYTDSSAASGSTYFYQVTAVNTEGESGASNEVTATAQSQSGGSLSLGVTVGASRITLNWNTVSGAVKYNVYRGTTSAVITNKTKISTGVTGATYLDTDATSGTTYYYQVTGVNSSDVEIQISNEVSAKF